MIMFALQPEEVEFIHNVRALTPNQSALLKTMARTLSHDILPVVIMAPHDNVRLLFPEHPESVQAFPGNGTALG